MRRSNCASTAGGEMSMKISCSQTVVHKAPEDVSGGIAQLAEIYLFAEIDSIRARQYAAATTAAYPCQRSTFVMSP
jgi:hypothetical protein